MTDLLTVRNVDVFYGALQAVRNVSFQVSRSGIVALLGPNGAGKSSIIRAACGLVRVEHGAIELDGRPIHGMRPSQRVRLGMATVQEGRRLFPSLTVEENLKMGAYARSDRGRVRADLSWTYEVFPTLRDSRDKQAGTLSGGQSQMLAIGRALMSRPRLLLLDEPSHGLAPKLVDEIFDLFPRLATDRDMAMLLVEQNANKALRTASYGYVLEAGKIALEGTSEKLAGDVLVKTLYLGG